MGVSSINNVSESTVARELRPRCKVESCCPAMTTTRKPVRFGMELSNTSRR